MQEWVKDPNLSTKVSFGYICFVVLYNKFATILTKIDKLCYKNIF